MNVDDAVPSPRTDDGMVRAVLSAAAPVLLVTDLQTPGGTADRTRSVLSSAGREVRTARPADFHSGDASGAVVALLVRPDQAADLARRAVEGRAAAVWLGPGLVSGEARAATEAAGVPYVEDRDLKLEFEVHVLGAPRRDFVPM